MPLVARASLPIAAAFAVALTGWLAGPAHADEIFIGPSASYGTAVPAGAASGNQRADQASSLTYLFTSATYTAPATGTLTVDDVNFANQSAGSITPFIAVYTGGNASSGSSYELLVTGDTFSVGAGSSQGVLVNQPFTVDGTSPTIAVTAGEVLVAGLYQTAESVVFANGTTTALIDNGDQIPATDDGAFPSGASYDFTTQLYRFDIGFSYPATVPEPATLGLLCAGIVGLGMIRRRPA
jgi:hypothetical protein